MSVSTSAPWCLAASLLAALVLGGDRPESPDPRSGGLVTLYAHDDLACSFDFRGGRAGGRVQDGEIRLESAQLAYDVFEPGHLSVGFADDERVALLDLGAAYVPPQRRPSDGAREFGLALFHTLQLDGSRFTYSVPGGSRRAVPAADGILGLLPLRGELTHLAPEVGHTYLLRATREGRAGNDDLFKLHVVAHRPGESLTLRWARP